MKEMRTFHTNKKRSYERPTVRVVQLQSEGRLLQASVDAKARDPYNQVILPW